jgi:hypothetical protein
MQSVAGRRMPEKARSVLTPSPKMHEAIRIEGQEFIRAGRETSSARKEGAGRVQGGGRRSPGRRAEPGEADGARREIRRPGEVEARFRLTNQPWGTKIVNSWKAVP